MNPSRMLTAKQITREWRSHVHILMDIHALDMIIWVVTKPSLDSVIFSFWNICNKIIPCNIRINSSPPSATYLRQTGSALVQIMAWRQIIVVNWTLRNKLQWNFNQNTTLFVHENASENIVCKTAAILSRGRWVNKYQVCFLSKYFYCTWQIYIMEIYSYVCRAHLHRSLSYLIYLIFTYFWGNQFINLRSFPYQHVNYSIRIIVL